MRVFITGGTGLIGRHLIRRLVERGDQPVVLSRNADKVRREHSMRFLKIVQGDPTKPGGWEVGLEGSDAVVNLAGHNLFANRWNREVKRTIRDSRVYSTENIISAMSQAKRAPKTLVQASAIGYYGPHGDEEITEESPSGSDFMAVVCREWEDAAHLAEPKGIRVAAVRTGIVLARGEGALGFMTPIFKWLPFGAAPVGNGGSLLKPGSGQQWMSWIHLDDIAGIFLLALDNPDVHGPINGTAPHPVRNAEFSKTLAKVLHRPFMPFGPPDAALGLVLGEVAEVVTKGQKVLPARAQALGYAFKYPNLLEALQATYAKTHASPTPTPVAASSGSHH